MSKKFFDLDPDRYQCLVDELSLEAFENEIPKPVFRRGQLVEFKHFHQWIPAIVVGEAWVLDQNKTADDGLMYERSWEYTLQPLVRESEEYELDEISRMECNIRVRISND